MSKSLFGELHFFGYRVSMYERNLNDIVERSAVVDAKYHSIFDAVDKNLDQKLEKNELIEFFNILVGFAKKDGNDRDLSVEEAGDYLNSLNKDGDTNLKANDLYDFVNIYLLKTKNLEMEHLGLIRMLTAGNPMDINIATSIPEEQYAELERLLSDHTNKYNLVNTPAEDGTILHDLQAVNDQFLKEYGKLVSSSREILLRGSSYAETIRRGDIVRPEEMVTGSKGDIETTIANIKKTGFANCAECQELIIELLYRNFGDKYEFCAINFKYDVPANDYGYVNHCAVLVRDKDGEEYIIDPWINPINGGIFIKSDWEKLCSEIFQSDNYCTENTDRWLNLLKSDDTTAEQM